MKKITLLSLFFLLVCGSTKFNMKDSPSQKTQTFLGEEFISILSHPDQVRAYRLEAHDLNKPDNIMAYPILEWGPYLETEQINRLQKLIFNDRSYNFETRKRCMFQPGIGYEFVKTDKKAYVILCFTCNEIMFAIGNNTKVEDIDAVIDQHMALKKEIFQI